MKEFIKILLIILGIGIALIILRAIIIVIF